MRISKNKNINININKMITFITFLSIFIFPTYILIDKTGYDITKYIFFIVSFALYLLAILYSKKIALLEILFIVMIIILCVIKKSIDPLSLIELVLIYRAINTLDFKKSRPTKKLLIFSSIGVLLYSLLYFNLNGRFLYTGLREVNQSSFAIFMLALIIKKFNKKLGNLALLLGILNFSRNYLLCLVIYYFLECIKNKDFYTTLSKKISFKKLAVFSIFGLILLSGIFEVAYENNKLVEYKSGFEKYVYIVDYSNYFRFTTNTNLIKIYIEKPEKLFTGIEEEEFYNYTRKIAYANNRRYRSIKPHNYFFSYFRIYGIFSIFIFVFVEKIINKVLTKNNFSIFIVVFIYSILLGVGFTNYWLFLTVITLNVHLEEKNERINNHNQNIRAKKRIK